VRAFRLLNPNAQDVPRAVGQHGEGQIHGLTADDRLVANFHAERVEEDDGTHRIERPRLPLADLG
jgi:hypothetical protein